MYQLSVESIAASFPHPIRISAADFKEILESYEKEAAERSNESESMEPEFIVAVRCHESETESSVRKEYNIRVGSETNIRLIETRCKEGFCFVSRGK